MSQRAWLALIASVLGALGGGCDASHPRAAAHQSVQRSSASNLGRVVTNTQSSRASSARGPGAGPVPRGFRPRSVTFVSAGTGWVLGSASCASPPCTSVLRTRDGGRSWHGIPAPRVRLADVSGHGVSELRFADALNGWAFGPDLWVTHDGGSHWHPLHIGRVGALAASGGKAVAVVGSGPEYRVLRTAVRGDGWHAVARFRQPDFRIAEGDLALSGGSGWLAGRSVLAVTGDSVRWSVVSNPCKGFSGGGGGGAWLTSPADGVLACAGQGAAGSAEKAIYGSSSRGHAFKLLGRPPRGGDFNAVAANRRFTVIVAAASGASEIYASFDGGRRYQTVLELRNGGIGWRDLGFTTDEQGVVVESYNGPGRMFLTRDGGHHWHTVRFTTG